MSAPEPAPTLLKSDKTPPTFGPLSKLAGEACATDPRILTRLARPLTQDQGQAARLARPGLVGRHRHGMSVIRLTFSVFQA